jgi:hypothetical protein
MHPAWTGPRQFLQFGAMNPIQFRAEVSKALTEARNRPAGRVVVAHWSRKYRPETETEHQLIHSIKSAFVTRRLEGSRDANDFDELEYLQIVAPRDAQKTGK